MGTKWMRIRRKMPDVEYPHSCPRCGRSNTGDIEYSAETGAFWLVCSCGHDIREVSQEAEVPEIKPGT